MAYEIDRRAGRAPTQPTLAQMTSAALSALEGAPEGFFLMVEAGRIDHAGHANDAPAAVAEVCAFHEAFAVARAFALRHGDVLVASTSDHDTGGLSVGCCGQYASDVGVLRGVTGSLESVGAAVAEALANGTAAREAVSGALAAAGMLGAIPAETVDAAAALAGVDQSHYDHYALGNLVGSAFAEAALVGFTSHAHTGGDVNLYCLGPGCGTELKGNIENADLGQSIIRMLGVDPAAGLEAAEERDPVLRSYASSP